MIDGAVAWTGGAGIEDHFENGGFHDVMVRVTGDVVRQAQAAFLTSFRGHGGPLPSQLSSFFPEPADAGSTPVALAQVIPGGHVAASQAIGEQIDGAQERLDVMNPYLTDRGMIDRIVAAGRRGVRVRVVISKKSNNAQATAALKHRYQDLLGAGVEVWELPDTVVHAKVVVADDIVSFGTVNLDAWALYRNSEIMMIVRSAEVAALIEERLFEPDIARSSAASRRRRRKSAARACSGTSFHACSEHYSCRRRPRASLRSHIRGFRIVARRAVALPGTAALPPDEQHRYQGDREDRGDDPAPGRLVFLRGCRARDCDGARADAALGVVADSVVAGGVVVSGAAVVVGGGAAVVVGGGAAVVVGGGAAVVVGGGAAVVAGGVVTVTVAVGGSTASVVVGSVTVGVDGGAVVLGSVGVVLVGRVAEGSVAVTSTVVGRLRIGVVRVASPLPPPQPATTRLRRARVPSPLPR